MGKQKHLSWILKLALYMVSSFMVLTIGPSLSISSVPGEYLFVNLERHEAPGHFEIALSRLELSLADNGAFDGPKVTSQVELNHQRKVKLRQQELDFFKAIETHQLSKIKAYIDSDANINALSSTGDSALHVAAHFNYPDVVRLLLNQDVTQVNWVNQHEETALMVASRRNAKEVVALLLADKRVEVEAITSDAVNSLMVAAYSNAAEALMLLIADGRIDPKLKDKYGATALEYAAIQNAAAAVKVLLNQGSMKPKKRTRLLAKENESEQVQAMMTL